VATIIDGKVVAADVKRRVAEEVALLKERGITPGLAAILVGDDPASQVYVRNKERDCGEVGIYSEVYRLPAATTQEELLDLVGVLNPKRDIHGILVQLPLPEHIDEFAVIRAIDPAKDVDGFTPHNQGLLLASKPCFKPCTPAGVIELLDFYGIELSGKHAVVVGRSNIVGKPAAILLLERHATVTVCHSRTRDLGSMTRQADVLVAAVGRPKLITAEMVKEGVVVIDVGINRVGDRLVGDVDFESVSEKASFITPVPGGVGLMTRAMLLVNTLQAAKQQAGLA
jgi:methylenetetrahydrofolate dehydrogenase (NADP+)/methenyltetrahydrofolate cyclohydrolase